MLTPNWGRIFKQMQKRRTAVTGLAPRREGFALARVGEDAAGEAALLHAGFYPCSPENMEATLAELTDRLDLLGEPCRLALNFPDYRLLQTQAPETPPDEIAQALRWRVQDMVDFPMEDAEIEYFAMPPSRRSGRDESLSVAVCRKSVLKRYARMCKTAGLKLDYIDIPELSLRNLAERLPESERGVALLYLEQERGMVQLQKGESVYLSRYMDFGSNRLRGELERGESGAQDDWADRLTLEVQRSLDYYESYFGMAPVGGLAVTPADLHVQGLVDFLNQGLSVMARALDVGALMSCRRRLDDAEQQLCLTAIGAALGGLT